ncbi:hypothetical protein FSOLCH5_001605 [Fusarium solani]
MKSHGRLTAAPCPVIRLIPPLGTDIVPMANAEKATSLRLQQPPPLLSGSSRPVGKWYGSGSVAIAAMVWYEGSDDWQRQFDSNDRISAQNENQPYLTNLANLTGSHHMVNEVESFMLVSHQASDIGDRHVERVQSLIEGDNSRSAITCPNVPVIWVWDLNCYPDRPRPHGSLAELSFGKKLSTEEFFELLRKERLPDSVGRTNSPLSPRRVYINNPSGDEIQELIRRIPPSQAEGFRELLTKYVHNKPQPHFGLRECTRWNQAFSFLFNCPYYALTTEDVEDRRTISNGRRSTKMRSRESLDFLYPSHYLKKNRHIRNQKSPGEARYIHDVVSSALITGQSDSYWTCFLFNEDMCLDPERQRLQADDELEEEGGTTDPITMTEQTAASLKPRVYGLQALVFQLDTIIRQQESIAECFEDSLVRFTKDTNPDIGSKQILEWGKQFRSILTLVIDRNSRLLKSLDTFLFVKDVRLVDGIPNGRLFQSLKRDPTAMGALHQLADLRQELENRKDGKIEEENLRFDEGQNLQQLIKTYAALQIVSARFLPLGNYLADNRQVLTLLALAVQLFDAWDPSQPVPFVIVVMLIAMICSLAFIYFFWRRRKLRRQHASWSAVDEESGGDEYGRNKQKRS